ncbi:hypothetical protein Ndes2526B_g05255 [Nannochloris sp. 'desiccata']
MPKSNVPPRDAKALRWLDDYQKVSKWLSKWDLEHLIEENNGIYKIKNFFPPFVAEEALNILERLPATAWLSTAAKEDYTHNNIEHSFLSTKTGSKDLEILLRVFSILLPDHLNAFSAGKYQISDKIDTHDDRAYTNIRMEDTGEVVLCSRDVTLVYHLTKDWTDEMGGALVDLETDTKYIPEFNSAIIFKVPRYHQVEPVLERSRPRYSIFGWYLLPGRLYELYDGKNTNNADGDDNAPKVEEKESGATAKNLSSIREEPEKDQSKVFNEPSIL